MAFKWSNMIANQILHTGRQLRKYPVSIGIGLSVGIGSWAYYRTVKNIENDILTNSFYYYHKSKLERFIIERSTTIQKAFVTANMYDLIKLYNFEILKYAVLRDPNFLGRVPSYTTYENMYVDIKQFIFGGKIYHKIDKMYDELILVILDREVITQPMTLEYLCPRTKGKDYSAKNRILQNNISTYIDKYGGDIKKLIDMNFNYYYRDFLFTKLIEVDPDNIKYIPTILNNYRDYIDLALRKNPLALRYVEHKYQTIEDARKCVMVDGLYIQYIGNKPEIICLLAVEQNPEALSLIPDENQTHEICAKAVSKKGETLQYCKNQTQNIVKLALTQNPDSIEHINFHYFQDSDLLDFIIFYLEKGGSFKKLEALLRKKDDGVKSTRCCTAHKKFVSLLRNNYIQQIALKMDPSCAEDLKYIKN
uniref:DUF4116 domain-containing protein n=1 Tax=viral metagenome TaxID=1070528 RepID=A0A6C0EBA7_9ZZZZ